MRRSSNPRPKVNQLRRVIVLLGTLLLMLATLSACGDDDGAGGEEADGTVTVSGKFGKEPKVEFDGTWNPGKTTTEVLSEGDGDEVADTDGVFANIYIANGYTHRKSASTWDDKAPSFVSLAETVPGIQKAIAGHKVGSRVEVQATPEDAFGEAGNPQLAIAPEDPVVFVVDIIKKTRDSVDTSKAKSPAGAPKVVEKDGVVTGIRFAGKQDKITELETITLVKGDGPKAKKGSTLAVKYLGQVNGKKKVFDENFSKDGLFSYTIGQQGVIQGWQDGTTGVSEGSRVILRIPSALGYGKKGSGEDIKGGDDLVFVVDVLGVN